LPRHNEAMNDTCEVDVYWTVQDGRRWSISLSEPDAWETLRELALYEENEDGWTVEHSREMVPIAKGEILEGEGEVVELDDEGEVASTTPFTPVHVFWNCPWCGNQHNTDLYHGRWGQRSRHTSPSIWFCERGKGIVLVEW
jgi:hypothetical protein